MATVHWSGNSPDERYYGVPIIQRWTKSVIFETDEDSQVIAQVSGFDKLESRSVPVGARRRAIHPLALHRERDRRAGFKLNDIYWQAEWSPTSDQLGFVRHKERKFGRGCIDQWRTRSKRVACPTEAPADALRGNADVTSRFCSMTGRALWISICLGCWATSFIPAITSFRQPTIN